MPKIEIAWTNDCQGKKDYDAKILRVSSRYWPQGGGFDIFDTSAGLWQKNDARPHIKPSAVSSILFGTETLAEMNFEGETEQEVKKAVEDWVEECLLSLTALLATWQPPGPRA